MSMESLQDNFERCLSQIFVVADDVDVICAWSVSYSEASRFVAHGLPKVTIEFPIEGARMMSFPESLYVMSLRYPDARVLVRPLISEAGYEVILIRGADRG